MTGDRRDLKAERRENREWMQEEVNDWIRRGGGRRGRGALANSRRGVRNGDAVLNIGAGSTPRGADPRSAVPTSTDAPLRHCPTETVFTVAQPGVQAQGPGQLRAGESVNTATYLDEEEQ